jgi:hypothetical protein
MVESSRYSNTPLLDDSVMETLEKLEIWRSFGNALEKLWRPLGEVAWATMETSKSAVML